MNHWIDFLLCLLLFGLACALIGTLLGMWLARP